jgi:hypothetical protein
VRWITIDTRKDLVVIRSGGLGGTLAFKTFAYTFKINNDFAKFKQCERVILRFG